MPRNILNIKPSSRFSPNFNPEPTPKPLIPIQAPVPKPQSDDTWLDELASLSLGLHGPKGSPVRSPDTAEQSIATASPAAEAEPAQALRDESWNRDAEAANAKLLQMMVLPK